MLLFEMFQAKRKRASHWTIEFDAYSGIQLKLLRCRKTIFEYSIFDNFSQNDEVTENHRSMERPTEHAKYQNGKLLNGFDSKKSVFTNEIAKNYTQYHLLDIKEKKKPVERILMNNEERMSFNHFVHDQIYTKNMWNYTILHQ